MTLFNALNLGIPALVGPRTVHLNVLPLFHTGGLNCYCNPVLHAGGTVLLMRQFDPAGTLAVIGDPDMGVTHFFGVPANYLFMLGDNRYDSKDGRYWGFVPRENVRGRPVFVYYSYRQDESPRPLPFITDIRWGRIGTVIR
jgi:acyl-CoA synthetase (AMP-forming)/AMP-acid ligase II